MENDLFCGTISKKVLENYLSRAVTAADLVNSDSLDDDLRMIGNIGAKFLGRASGIWMLESDDKEHFRKSKVLAERVHAVDPEIILQTCIFEAIFRGVENIAIPDFVFTAFELPVEERAFRFDQMLFDNEPYGYKWDQDGGIPDISKLETQMWFYYRAVSYIEAGYEAIHMGQIHLYAADDSGYKKTYALFDRIRAYARQHARRKLVLLDAHTHGVNVEGRLLFDFHSMPYTRVPILDRTGEKLTLVREGFSEGGITPSGWSCETLPMLMEYDNWGGKFFKDEDHIPYEQRAWMEWWGYDQIAWFASQDEASRNEFLHYTFKWTAVNNVNAYFQMPVRRTLGSCRIVREAYGTNAEMSVDCYKANRPGSGCPEGFGQEDTIKLIWESDHQLRERAGNPSAVTPYGAEDDYDSETGVKLPGRVIVFGNFQHYLGAVNHDSNSETTRMYHMGKGIYMLSCVFPFKGTYEYAVAPYGTLSQLFSIDNYPRSGSSTKAVLTVEADNSVVCFRFDFSKREVRADIISGL
ncbi:hypothetical protein [Paenibacillus nasutitermitis]|uniref:Uncharacterized protein n=1 Tax=Paenibacillus nasutitermitis TaxID=1652958 RepID=A0A917DLH0_9BACL|nr:hypothetical protein [Paenibacillus nasutitermitis]GGD47737.1 hypothetical protein GCM10010911_01570 [Paenibacillus nasutitermitis]